MAEFDAEFGMELSEVGEDYTFGAAEAGEAVDAAVGLARYAPRPRPRGVAPQRRQAQRPLYTYGVGLPTVTAAMVTAAAIGTVQYRVNTSFQIIDFVCICTAATFLLTSFYVGDTNMWLGANPMPADMFGPAVQNRGLRFTTARGGRDISIGWNSAVGTTTLQTLVMALKVRSYFRG